MTDNQIRTALEEASQGSIEYFEGVWFYWSNGNRFACKDNDPLEDLNACAELEATLTEGEERDYTDELIDITHNTVPVSATARQRAEAFLKTLYLWKD